MRKIFVVLSLLVMVCTLTSCKYPQTLDEKAIHATICERIYEEDRNYYFIALSAEDGSNKLTFRTNKKFYESVEVGQTMDITYKKLGHIDGSSVHYYWNGNELENCFIHQASGDVQVEVVEANMRIISSYNGKAYTSRKVYDLVFKDMQGEKRTARDVSQDLWESLFAGEILFLERKENTAKIKTHDYDYYLNGVKLFES